MKIIKFPEGCKLFNQNGFKGYIGKNCYVEAEKTIIIEIKGEKPKEKEDENTKTKD